MHYIGVSNISGSSGCNQYVFDNIKNYRGSTKNGKNNTSGEAAKRGTAVHEIIQQVLSLPPKSRNIKLKDYSRDLELLRKDLEASKELKNAVSGNYFGEGLIQKRIVETWCEAVPLLEGCLNLLHYLEKRIPRSAGKWTIKVEVSIHKDESAKNDYNHKPGLTKDIFDSIVAIHGFIDLVFEFEDYRILGELKTGYYSEEKHRNWMNQVGIYLDVWVEKHPEHNVFSVVIHKGLENGYEWRTDAFDWNLLNDKSKRNNGPQCSGCRFRDGCSESEHR
jgi:hypothetical protein